MGYVFLSDWHGSLRVCPGNRTHRTGSGEVMSDYVEKPEHLSAVGILWVLKSPCYPQPQDDRERQTETEVGEAGGWGGTFL